MASFRADRLATLYFFQPLGHVCGRAPGIPILMYHSISDDAEQGHPYFHTNTSPGVFAEHLAVLRKLHYRTTTLDGAIRTLDAPAAEMKNTVVLTFDDGYEDFYTKAFPLLARYGFTATMFLPTAYIGPTSRQFKGRQCLSWSQVHELRRAGIEFGSHTVTHPQLHDVTPRQLRDEVTLSKQELEHQLGEAVSSFSYPYAFPQTDRPFVGRLSALLEETGYRRGVSTAIGRASARNHPLFLKRLPANSQDDARFLQAKLEGAYDWLQAFQYASKIRIRRKKPISGTLAHSAAPLASGMNVPNPAGASSDGLRCPPAAPDSPLVLERANPTGSGQISARQRLFLDGPSALQSPEGTGPRGR